MQARCVFDSELVTWGETVANPMAARRRSGGRGGDHRRLLAGQSKGRLPLGLLGRALGGVMVVLFVGKKIRGRPNGVSAHRRHRI